MRVLPITLSLLLLGGCSLMPEYQRPDVQPLNADWDSSASARLAAADTGWQQIFADPALQRVIRLGLDNNRDLRVALLNVERYRAQYRIRRAALLPAIDASGSDARQRLPGSVNSSGNASIYSRSSATIGLSAYELDLFGRVRSLKTQALENYLAQQQSLRSSQLTLVANLADAYLSWVADREQLALAQQDQAIEADNVKLVRQRYNLGVASELALAQAQAALEDAGVTLSRYQRLLKLDRNALTLLVGAPLPDDWAPRDKLTATTIADVTPGLPSELLTRRPDILAAEHTLKGADANIGAARAAFFPTVSLTANAGVMSNQLSDLFGGNNGTWLFTPTITLPIFNGGRLRAQLDTAKVDQKIALTHYEKAIQNAFTEVADALANRDGYAKQLASQQRALAAHQHYFDIADQRYRNGVDSMLTRLDAQRNLVSAQQATISARLSLLQSKVDLYRALGGGWSEKNVQPSTTHATTTKAAHTK